MHYLQTPRIISINFVYSLWHWEILVDEKVLVHVDSYKLCSVGLMKTY